MFNLIITIRKTRSRLVEKMTDVQFLGNRSRIRRHGERNVFQASRLHCSSFSAGNYYPPSSLKLENKNVEIARWSRLSQGPFDCNMAAA